MEYLADVPAAARAAPELQRVREDMDTLVGFAKAAEVAQAARRSSCKTFLTDNGVG